MVSNTDKAIISFANIEQLKAVAAFLGEATNTPVNKMISAIAKLEGMNQKSYKDLIQSQGGVHIIPVELIDMGDYGKNSIKGRVSISEQGVGLGFSGYETLTECPDKAIPIWVEYFDDSPRVIVWSDKALEDSTHHVYLTNAATEKVELPEIDYVDGQYKIDGVSIPDDVWHEGFSDVCIEDREERISDLEMWIGEIHNESPNSRRQADLPLMREDLATLNDSTEDYVLGWYGTNGFIIPEEEAELFVEKCHSLVSQAEEFAHKERTDLLEHSSDEKRIEVKLSDSSYYEIHHGFTEKQMVMIYLSYHAWCRDNNESVDCESYNDFVSDLSVWFDHVAYHAEIYMKQQLKFHENREFKNIIHILES